MTIEFLPIAEAEPDDAIEYQPFQPSLRTALL